MEQLDDFTVEVNAYFITYIYTVISLLFVEYLFLWFSLVQSKHKI